MLSAVGVCWHMRMGPGMAYLGEAEGVWVMTRNTRTSICTGVASGVRPRPLPRGGLGWPVARAWEGGVGGGAARGGVWRRGPGAAGVITWRFAPARPLDVAEGEVQAASNAGGNV